VQGLFGLCSVFVCDGGGQFHFLACEVEAYGAAVYLRLQRLLVVVAQKRVFLDLPFSVKAQGRLINEFPVGVDKELQGRVSGFRELFGVGFFRPVHVFKEILGGLIFLLELVA